MREQRTIIPSQGEQGEDEMEKLLFVKDIMKRYGCSQASAYKKMHEMRHMTAPLAVYEADVLAYERMKLVEPGEKAKETRGRRGVTRRIWAPLTSENRIPRRKEE